MDQGDQTLFVASSSDVANPHRATPALPKVNATSCLSLAYDALINVLAKPLSQLAGESLELKAFARAIASAAMIQTTYATPTL